ncbi:Gamma thionin [Cynara cardunculus var. scolymus]|uniref:Gamma thionin n=1 Tax=Cynara cardunculus var. scolymus TaxID=59895 RepID=A0A103YE22_CYNCS|nr:Gamma thionin [Cynara cardunculus var. scolymus]
MLWFKTIVTIGIAEETMVKVIEAKMCQTTGHAFSCVNDSTCNGSCEKQGFASGKCDGLRRRCTCYKQC